jgi:hypothetical protein
MEVIGQYTRAAESKMAVNAKLLKLSCLGLYRINIARVKKLGVSEDGALFFFSFFRRLGVKCSAFKNVLIPPLTGTLFFQCNVKKSEFIKKLLQSYTSINISGVKMTPFPGAKG